MHPWQPAPCSAAIATATYRAVVLLLQQGGHVPPDGHLLGQVLVLGTDPAPQLLQQAQQAGPPLSTGLQVGPVRGQRSKEVRVRRRREVSRVKSVNPFSISVNQNDDPQC